MESQLQPNTVVAGRYLVERELGRGGMATVYLAHDQRHETPVALKLLHPDLASVFSGERFQREIRITASMQHPQIIPVLDSGAWEGIPFYVMPFVRGESLASRLERERQLGLLDSLQIAIDIADALAYAHAQGVIHRDIKPDNILLSSGHAVISDFGIARAIDAAGGERLTQSGVAIGTATYMSPEQGAGGAMDARSDLYSLGCVLYEMLTGAPPFAGSTPLTVLARHALDPVPPLRTARPTVSPAVEAVVSRALAKVPGDRFGSAAEMRTALVAAAGEQSGPVDSWTGARPVVRRRRTWPAAIAVGAALTAGTVLWILSRGSDESLDPNRIAVFPLSVPADIGAETSMGEDIATMIGHALDGTGPLRWIDGWRVMQASGAGGSPPDLRALARSMRSRFYLTGRVARTSQDSVTVFLELLDASGDSTVRSGRASGPAVNAWQLGVRATNMLLPALIPGAASLESAPGLDDRHPQTVATFLLGEAAYRRGRFEESLQHFRAAVATDSTFAYAALRAAEMSAGKHRYEDAAEFVRLALAQPLPERFRLYATGYAAYLEGRPDSAVATFRRLLALDPGMSSAWKQLGESYTHLLHAAGATEVLADSAFAEARRLDSTSVPLLAHPIEFRLRRGDVAGAAPLIQRYLDANPDSGTIQSMRVLQTCVSKGPQAVDWEKEVAEGALLVLGATKLLAVGGAQLPCAIAGYSALRTYETAAMAAADRDVDTRRWTALVGLQGVLFTQGRLAEAAAMVDSAIERGEGGLSLRIIQGTLESSWEPGARQAVAEYERQWGPRCRRCPSNERLWQLGVWYTHTGDSPGIAEVAAILATRAAASLDPRITLMARATAAREQLMRGDTTRAIAALYDVLAFPIPSGGALQWSAAEGRGPERLALARAHYAKGEYSKAMEVADIFDGGQNQTLLPYLRSSLELRIRAATAAGDPARLAEYRAKLKRLGGSASR